MKSIVLRAAVLRIAVLALGACALLPAPRVVAAEPAAAASCEPWRDMRFVCGPTAAEDLVRVDDTPWLIAAGLAGPGEPGRLHLIDSEKHTWEVAYPASGVLVSPEPKRFQDCTTAPDGSAFSAHGIAIRRTGAGRHELLVVNHGGREAIEFFAVSSRGAKPVLTWVGCVRMPADVYANSLTPLANGGFLATRFYAPSEGGIGKVFSGAVTGGVLEWSPGRAVTEIPGTRISGANGIETSHRGRVIYVAAWGTREMVRFDRRGPTLKKTVVPMEFAPDNLRWASNGQLLVAGQKFQPPAPNGPPPGLDGWHVVYVHPETLAVTPVYSVDASGPMQGVSAALEVEGQMWVAPFRGDRVGYFPVPR